MTPSLSPQVNVLTYVMAAWATTFNSRVNYSVGSTRVNWRWPSTENFMWRCVCGASSLNAWMGGAAHGALCLQTIVFHEATRAVWAAWTGGDASEIGFHSIVPVCVCECVCVIASHEIHCQLAAKRGNCTPFQHLAPLICEAILSPNTWLLLKNRGNRTVSSRR